MCVSRPARSLLSPFSGRTDDADMISRGHDPPIQKRSSFHPFPTGTNGSFVFPSSILTQVERIKSRICAAGARTFRRSPIEERRRGGNSKITPRLFDSLSLTNQPFFPAPRKSYRRGFAKEKSGFAKPSGRRTQELIKIPVVRFGQGAWLSKLENFAKIDMIKDCMKEDNNFATY